MKDFNNIETDPIPEGLEFNESYMQSAFALYDAEKRKRKRRLLIWWITSALGFSCVLLIGMFFFTREEASGYSGKKTPAEKKTFTEKSVVADSKPTTNHKTQPSKISQLNDLKNPAAKNSKLQVKNATAGTSVSTGNLSTSKTKSNKTPRLRSASPKKRIRKTNGNIPGSGDQSGKPGNKETVTEPGSDTMIPEVTKETDQTDSSLQLPLVELPLKRAELAYTYDSTLRLSVNLQKDPPQPEATDSRAHHVFLNLGVNTLFGINELKNRATFRESIGISYTYQVNPRFTIGTGLEYHSISRISFKRIIGDTTNSNNTTTILNKTTLNYISFSPQVQYQLWPNHRITAGFGIEYLLTDPGERYEIDNYTQESQKRTNSKLYYSTFNRFNFSASLGYVYQFSRFMSVQASYHYGFTDITINNSFNNTFDRNSRLQLGLKIKLY